MKQEGYLEVIIGPMYSGKTEELIRLAKRATFAKKKIQMFKHAIDTRYGKEEKLYSHAGTSFTAQLVQTATDINEAIKSSTQLIGIDEAQWFGGALIPVVLEQVKKRKHVVVAGLGLTYDKQPFIPMPELCVFADSVTKLTAICTICGNNAMFHKRVKGETTVNPLSADPSLVTSLEDNIFQARCRNCFEII